MARVRRNEKLNVGHLKIGCVFKLGDKYYIKIEGDRYIDLETGHEYEYIINVSGQDCKPITKPIVLEPDTLEDIRGF